MLGRVIPHLTVNIGIDRAAAAHGDDDGRDVGAPEPLGQIRAQFLGRGFGIVRHEEDAGLRLVADEAVHALQKIPPLGGDAHVGHHAVDRLAVLLRQIQHALDDVLADIRLDDHTVGIAEDLVPFFIENAADGPEVRPPGDGAGEVAGGVEHCQPHTHAVWNDADIVGVDLVLSQLADDLLALGAPVHQTHEGGAQLHIGDILRHIAAHAAVDKLNGPGVAPGRQIQVVRKALDIHEDGTHDYDRHSSSSRMLN